MLLFLAYITDFRTIFSLFYSFRCHGYSCRSATESIQNLKSKFIWNLGWEVSPNQVLYLQRITEHRVSHISLRAVNWIRTRGPGIEESQKEYCLCRMPHDSVPSRNRSVPWRQSIKSVQRRGILHVNYCPAVAEWQDVCNQSTDYFWLLHGMKRHASTSGILADKRIPDQ
jgi:hypothetical protein